MQNISSIFSHFQCFLILQVVDVAIWDQAAHRWREHLSFRTHAIDCQLLLVLFWGLRDVWKRARLFTNFHKGLFSFTFLTECSGSARESCNFALNFGYRTSLGWNGFASVKTMRFNTNAEFDSMLKGTCESTLTASGIEKLMNNPTDEIFRLLMEETGDKKSKEPFLKQLMNYLWP